MEYVYLIYTPIEFEEDVIHGYYSNEALAKEKMKCFERENPGIVIKLDKIPLDVN